MEFVIAIIIIFIAAIVAGFSQIKTIGKLETEKLIPIVDALYADPTSREKHKLFIDSLKFLDIKIKKYGDGFSYTPSELITEKLLRHIEDYPQDKLAHDRFIELIRRTKHLSSEFLFKKLLSHLIIKMNSLSNERFAICLSKAHLLPESLLDSLFDYLEQDPINPIVQQNFLQCVMHIMLLSADKRQYIYEESLSVLEANPTSSAAKQFVLNVGRWHFGKSRKSGRVTIYDEQRIQNDILARAI